jgi:hypothetical protein
MQGPRGVSAVGARTNVTRECLRKNSQCGSEWASGYTNLNAWIVGIISSCHRAAEWIVGHFAQFGGRDVAAVISRTLRSVWLAASGEEWGETR